MRTIRKKYKIRAFSYDIHVSITRHPRNIRRAFKISRQHVGVFLLLFFAASLFVLVSHVFEMYNSAPYYTKTSLLLEQISPVLGKRSDVSEEKEIKNKEKREKIVFAGDRKNPKIALTFDADMTPEMRAQVDSGMVAGSYNKEVVDVLNATKTKATFFISGMWMEKYPDIMNSFAENAFFELANHSYSHPSFEGFCYGLRVASEMEAVNEVKKTQQLLRSMTGKENKFFRFPGGCYAQQDLEMLQKLGLTAIQWDVEGRDGFNYDARNIEENVLKNVKNGSIIVLHMNGYPNSPVTAQALPRIIAELRLRGFEFVTISELLENAEETRVFATDSTITKSLLLSYK